MNEYRLPLPGSSSQSVHLVLAASRDAPWIAVYSSGSRARTRFPLTTACVFGNSFFGNVPTDTSVEPNDVGRTMRACSIPGRRTSPVHTAVPETIGGIEAIGWDVPTTLY